MFVGQICRVAESVVAVEGAGEYIHDQFGSIGDGCVTGRGSAEIVGYRGRVAERDW